MKKRTKWKIQLTSLMTIGTSILGYLFGFLLFKEKFVFTILFGLSGLVSSLFVITLTDYGDYMDKKHTLPHNHSQNYNKRLLLKGVESCSDGLKPSLPHKEDKF